jgi:hypothetical protein
MLEQRLGVKYGNVRLERPGHIGGGGSKYAKVQAVHVNPGYTETIRYKTNPEAAQVSWIAQSNSAADASEYFTFRVNEAAKTISVTGVKLGGRDAERLLRGGFRGDDHPDSGVCGVYL